MKASLLKDTLKALHPQLRTVAVEGAPGGGKTSIVQQVARELGIHYIEKHMPTMLVEDFGVPDMMASGDSFAYKLPDWFPAKGSKYDDGKGGILCFDDRNQANADLQKVLANICQARNLHGVQIADGWQVISTGNRQSDRAGANRVLSHLRNRETVIELDTDYHESMRWMVDNGTAPEVRAYLSFKPAMLHNFDPQQDSNPSPRSWHEGVSAVLRVVPLEAEYECFKGAVGEGAAAEFKGFMEVYRQLPNPDNVILHPDTADVPTDPATLYALSGALAERATETNFSRVIKYTGRMPPEFSVLTVSFATRKNAELANTDAFNRWAVDHQDVLF